MLTAMETVEMARFARGVGDVAGCVSLSDSAVRQATQEHHPDAAYMAAEVPGRMFMGRGEPREAIAHYRYALDLARLHNLKNRLGGAVHDLALAVRETGDGAQFRRLAAEAFEHYSHSNPRDPCLTGLLADVAQDAFDRHPNDREKASAALQAWRGIPVCMKTVRYHMAAAAQQMVASATLGIRSRYDSAAEALDAYRLDMPDHEAVAMTFAYAARGALAMMDFEGAAYLCEIAIREGDAREESVPAEEARGVLADALAERNIFA